ncbi:hypothetical protein [Micromonospora sp. NPDC048830]|uniref:hypothetical protein n=1 Tax=Micromonospora sp. NPDC048830 TaxID=3364257 RepID=UPI003711807E
MSFTSSTRPHSPSITSTSPMCSASVKATWMPANALARAVRAESPISAPTTPAEPSTDTPNRRKGLKVSRIMPIARTVTTTDVRRRTGWIWVRARRTLRWPAVSGSRLEATASVTCRP